VTFQRTSVLCGVLVTLGCGARKPEVAALTAPASCSVQATSEERIDVPITFESPSGKVLPVPMVTVRFGAHTTNLIVDSGASDHVLTRAFVRRAGIRELGQHEVGTDHNNAAFQASKIETQRASFGGSTLVFEGYVVEGPPPFEMLGVGGFISPQRLIREGTVIVDLDGKRLYALPCGEPESKQWFATHGHTPLSLETAWSKNKPFVSVALGERAPVVGELDTGGSTTEVSEGYVGGSAGPMNCQQLAVSGQCVEGATLADQTVNFAGRAFGGVLLSVRKDIAHGDGLKNEHMLIGMDVLRRCALALPQSRTGPVQAACAH
jgi:hypothetical protein